MEILIIIICIIVLIPCIKQIQKNRQANSVEGIRAQFNSSAPVVDTRTLSPAEAKNYYYKLKSEGKEVDSQLMNDLSNIIGKEYEDMLLEELEDLISDEINEWVYNHQNAGMLFTSKVYLKIIELKNQVKDDDD